MKTVLVTGANRGIGYATAMAFRNEGYRVLGTARQSEDRMKLRDQGIGAYELEMTKMDSIESLYQQLKSENLLPDILINNAGIAHLAPLTKTCLDSFDETLSVNLRAAFFLTQKFVSHMSRQQYGRIVSVSSILSSLPQKGFASYAAAKAGLEAFSRVAALEYAHKGVTVNCIAAGFVETDMIKGLANAEQLKSQIPTRSVASPDEIAQSILLLTKQANITGEVIQTNGGLLMKP